MGKRFEKMVLITCKTTLLTVFNFIFWCIGFAMALAAIMTRMELGDYVDMSPEGSGAVLMGLVFLGILIVLVATAACGCTVRGRPALLYLYGGFLAVIAALELAAGASAYAYRKSLADGLDQALNESLVVYGTETHKNDRIDTVQSVAHCCGNKGYTDWLELKPPKEIPSSCCKGTMLCDPENIDTIWTEGCYNRIIDYMNSHIGILAACAVGLAFYPLIGVFLACCLASNISKSKYQQVA